MRAVSLHRLQASCSALAARKRRLKEANGDMDPKQDCALIGASQLDTGHIQKCYVLLMDAQTLVALHDYHEQSC